MVRIDLSYKNIKSILDLNIPINVEELDLSHNNIKSLKGIEKFTNLKELYIGYNKLKSLHEIQILTNLIYLFISDNKIRSLTGIEKLIKLRFLCISNNKIKSIVGIEKLGKLKYLDIKYNPLVPIYKYNLIKYIGAEPQAVPHLRSSSAPPTGSPTWVLTYNYWQVKKYPQHLKQLIFDYYKMYFINKYKKELVKNELIKEVYNL